MNALMMKLFWFLILALQVSLASGQNPTASKKANILPDFESLPKIQWKFKTNLPVIASPVVSGDLVYVGGLDSALYAIEKGTGKLKWKFKTGGEIRSTVCLNDDQLFLFSGDATLYSIDKLTGKVQWTFKTKGGILGDRRYDFADYFQSSPVVSNGRIFFGAGDSRVYALAIADGKVLWSFKA